MRIKPVYVEDHSPAHPVTRFFAAVVDIFVVLTMLIVLGKLDWIISESAESSPYLGVLILIIYSTVFEGWFGTSPGKRLLLLAVRNEDGEIPGIVKGVIRTSVFWMIFLGTVYLVSFIPGFEGGLPLAVFLLFVMARKRNYWRGLHDLVSRTVVVNRPGSE